MLTDSNLDLVAERIDLAVRLGPSVRADVIGVKLLQTRYHVVASPEYIRRAGPLAAPMDLKERSCLLLSLPEFRTRWIFRTASGDINVPVSGRFVISSPLALRSAAIDGMGPTLLPSWLIEHDLAHGRLSDLFPDHAVTATTFETAAWLLYPSREYLSCKTRSAIAFFREQFRRPPQAA